MMQGNKIQKLMATGTMLVAIAALNGCGQTNTTAQGVQFDGAQLFADSGLGAGDSLGSQVFYETSGSPTTVAMFHQAEDAFAVAEAQEAAGTYDEWYASFDRPGVDDGTGTAVAGADSKDSEPEGIPAVVGVEITND
jgi:hypothetical protein